MTEYDFSFKDIVESAQDIIVVTRATSLDDPGPEIVYVNQAFTDLTGYSYEEAVGKSPRILQSDGTDENTKREIRAALEKQQPIRTIIKNYTKGGQEYWLDMSILPMRNPQGEVTHFVAIERDATEQQELQNKLEALSHTDHLTSVLNRRSLDQILRNEFARYKRSGSVYACLMIDIDHFKKINDRFGHNLGDKALQAVAGVLETSLRQYDSVARIGGEEFAVLLPATSKITATSVAEKLRLRIEHLLKHLDGIDLDLTISIGSTIVSPEDNSPEDLLERADRLLYQAKEQGRNQVCSD